MHLHSIQGMVATDIVFYEYHVNTGELLNSEIVKVPDPNSEVTITTTLTGFVQAPCDVYQNGEYIGGYYPVMPYVHSITIDVIKMQNENLIQESHIISEKLDGQNIRLSKLEQTVKDSQLSELPKQIASIEASVKSAHHRIDALENNH